MSRIRLTIDQFVFKGFEPGDRNALVEGLQGELSQALTDPVARAEWAHSHRTPVLRLGPMPLEPGPAGSKRFGKGLAKGIGKGLKS